MSEAHQLLPISEQVAPQDQAALAEVVASACRNTAPVYPIGGGTALDYGLRPVREGIGLELNQLNRVVDYAPRDMTITVESGITLAAIDEILADENQQLPIDIPDVQQATLGGAIATNCSGPRRFGMGTLRDYVIGITAIDGRGTTFHGGGRVVKNVAGYDFCKLLIGSLGTLAVITQVTLKLKPRPTRRAWLVCGCESLQQSERLLEALVTTSTAPVAIELLVGAQWKSIEALALLPPTEIYLAVLLEGSEREVGWQCETLQHEWRQRFDASTATIAGKDADSLLSVLTNFPRHGVSPEDASPLVLQGAVAPSQLTQFLPRFLDVDPNCQLQCHAGNGAFVARFCEFDAADISKLLVGQLQAFALTHGGHLHVLANTLEGLTHQSAWGGRQRSFLLMESVKRQFDPQRILNPGRFIFTD